MAIEPFALINALSWQQLIESALIFGVFIG